MTSSVNPVWLLMVVCACSQVLIVPGEKGHDPGGSTAVYDAAYSQPVTVHPPKASCGEDPDFSHIILNTPWDFGPLNKVFGKKRVVQCASECLRTHPQKHEFQELLPDYPPLTVGHPDCTPSLSGLDPQGPCYEDVGYERTTQATYSLWVYPESANPGTILDAGTFRLDQEDGDLVLVLGTIRHTHSSWGISLRGWTHLAVQFDLDSPTNYVQIHMNGSLCQRSADLPPSPPGLSYNIRLGASKDIDEQDGCSLSQIYECRSVGHAASIMAVNPGARSTPESAYVDFQSDLDLLQDSCSADPKRIVRYTCAYFYPECNVAGKVIRPCKSLCQDMQAQCGLDGVNWALHCDPLPTDDCTTLEALTDRGLFYGQLRGIKVYSSVLTNREIRELYDKTWLPARPLSQCMCDSKYPRFNSSVSHVHCFTNPPEYRRQPRLIPVSKDDDVSDAFFFLPEFVNDNFAHYHYNVPLIWVSTPGFQNVSLQIHFEEAYEIESVTIRLVSSPPDGLIMVEKRLGLDWIPWQYFSWDCEKLGFPAVTSEMQSFTIKEPYSAGCIDLRFVLIDFDPVITFGRRNPPTLIWNVTMTQPGRLGNWFHEQLKQYMLSEGIRITFSGYPKPRASQEAELGNDEKNLDNNDLIIAKSDSRKPNIDIEKVHAVVNIAAYGRRVRDMKAPPCGCFPGIVCVDEQCQCPSGENTSNFTNDRCIPEVSSINPTYGPKSGGTDLTVTGQYLASYGTVGFVNIGQEECHLISINDSVIQCVTVPSDTSLETSLNVKVRLEGLQDLVTDENSPTFFDAMSPQMFTYKPDPLIYYIAPKKTIIRGGINLTVSGNHLDSVAKPQMFIIMFHRGRHKPQAKELCTVVDSKKMICPTSAIDLPAEYKDLDVVSSNLVSYNNIIENTAQKVKRQVQSDTNHGKINNDKLQFYINFKMDGVVPYDEDSVNPPSMYNLEVFRNPFIMEFLEEPYVFIPNEKGNLVIKGDYLNSGCDIEDYIVTVGTEICPVVLLLPNEIHCKPPTINNSVAVKVRVGNTETSVGVIEFKKASSIWEIASVQIGIVIGVVLIVLLTIMSIAIYCCRMRRIAKYNEYEMQRIHGTEVLYRIAPRPTVPAPINPRYSALKPESPDLMDLLDDDLRLKVQQCLVASERLFMQQEVGKGHFARIYSGWFKDEHSEDKTLVAIKTVKNELATIEIISEFLQEAIIMKDFSHENIMPLLGVIVELNHVYVIIPMMENGNLRAFVAHPDNMFTVRQLVEFGLQVAKGMAYLENNGFVHRDLAARNCMVSRQFVVKIADFGLAKDLYEKDYCKSEDKHRLLPIKWTALECLQGLDFTSKSDVWSFGVLMWEILTRGKKPYSDITNQEVKGYLLSGKRLEMPEYCPHQLYKMMTSCWNTDPGMRPTFGEIVTEIKSLLNADSAAASENTNDGYLLMRDPETQGSCAISTDSKRESQNENAKEDVSDKVRFLPDRAQAAVANAPPKSEYVRNGAGEGIYDMPDDGTMDTTEAANESDCPPRIDAPPVPPVESGDIGAHSGNDLAPPGVQISAGVGGVEDYTAPVDMEQLRLSGTRPGSTNKTKEEKKDDDIDSSIPPSNIAGGLYDNNVYINQPAQSDGYIDMSHSRRSKSKS